MLLGLLRDGPLHGYELKRILEEEMGDWADIAFGSIYFALGKLKDEGFVSTGAPEQEGRRPARIVYAITDSGRAEFLRLLRETLGSADRPRYGIDTAVAFLDALPRAEAASFFRERIVRLEAALRFLRAHEAEERARPGIPPAAAAIFAHSLFHLEAELAWSRQVLAGLE